MVVKKIVSVENAEKGKKILYEIVSMLVGLIKSSSDRIYEEGIEYKIND